MRVDQFTPVVFSNAWDHLVLEPNTKGEDFSASLNPRRHVYNQENPMPADLIKSLVQQHTASARRRAVVPGLADAEAVPELCQLPQNGPTGVTDVIAGKGGGLVIVLHGKPGVG